MYILNIGRNIHILFNDNVIYQNVHPGVMAVGKVSINLDCQENEVMPLLHETLQLSSMKLSMAYTNLLKTPKSKI